MSFLKKLVEGTIFERPEPFKNPYECEIWIVSKLTGQRPYQIQTFSRYPTFSTGAFREVEIRCEQDGGTFVVLYANLESRRHGLVRPLIRIRSEDLCEDWERLTYKDQSRIVREAVWYEDYSGHTIDDGLPQALGLKSTLSVGSEGYNLSNFFVANTSTPWMYELENDMQRLARIVGFVSETAEKISKALQTLGYWIV